jgi:phage terminase large subunit-like protein
LAILDETGQVKGTQDDFIDAVITSQGAHKSPLLLVISTQAASDNDLLSVWIEDAKNDKNTICHVYEAPKDSDLMDEAAWRAANPAIGKFRSIDDMRQMAEQATRMPSFENSFRNLYLNQRISVHSAFINKSAWLACDGEPCPISECDEVYGGLDLSGRTDLTSFVLYGRKGDTWNAYCHFWTPEKGLFDRAKRDRAPYDVWVNMGLIRTIPGASIDYETVARDIADICSGVEVITIAYDRWRMDVLKKEFERIGVDLPLTEWGQGFKDMAPAVDALEQVILNEKLRHGGNPVLTMCMNNAAVVRSPANDRKLDKSKSTARIDGAVALAMACGVAERMAQPLIDIDDIVNNALIL